MPPHDVYVTGIGIVSPAGSRREATWASLLAGHPCVQHLDRDCSSGCVTDFAGQVDDFGPPAGYESADRVCQFAIAAAEEAVNSAHLSPDDFQACSPQRCRVSVGTSKGGILTFASISEAFSGRTHLPHVLTSHWDDIYPDASARHIANRFGIIGGVHTSVAACSTGMLAVIRAAQWINDGDADLVICGSSDASLHPVWFGAFEQMRVLASAHPSLGPGWACRPFDRTRDGFAMGEGAAILVLESSESVQKRGCSPIARIAGCATGSDPAGLTRPTVDGAPLCRVIELACQRANCPPAEISCIHAHGTATLSNDLQETQAICQVLGACASGVPIVSLKGAIGHLLGAAGAIEVAVAALTCRDRVSPGTTTLLELDPQLGPLSLPQKSFEMPGLRAVLKTSLGFGGQIAAAIIEPV